MQSLKIKEDLFWTGVLDYDLKTFDIIMETKYGTTYNSYLLKGSEKNAIFETAKLKFYDDYIKELEQIIAVKDIDYIIVNHTEPDHAGSIENLITLNPDIEVVGSVAAIKFLKNIVNKEFKSIVIDEKVPLSLGNKTLKFIKAPNLHWPDTMYTYVEEDKVLFTCDSFGAHYCFDEILVSKVTNKEDYMSALKYYFDNIIGHFKPFMLKALDRIKDLDIEMICTGHGPVIDTGVKEIQKMYRRWSTETNPNPGLTVVIPYVSAYGYTKELAGSITEGIKASGAIDVHLYDMEISKADEVVEDMRFANGILLGSPTILADALEPIWNLTTLMFGPTHGGKLASAFGSYGWSGEAVPNLIERLKQLKLKTVDGFKVCFKPSKDELKNAYDYGYNFGCLVQNKPNDK